VGGPPFTESVIVWLNATELKTSAVMLLVMVDTIVSP